MKYPQLVSMPSAVSDWLEEQLDARGIDAVVYTRYVLSLLQHHHSQDEDLGELEHEFRQQHAKESSVGGKQPSGRGGSGNKRLRRSWFQHVVRVADVEQLRRSAAVEALMSAAEQKCGIESLVDELCEKLKHFESNAEATESKAPASNTPNRTTISPADLARKYYAAFPALNCKSSSSKLITLIPQICTQNTANSGNNSIQKRKHNRRPIQSHSHNYTYNYNYNRSVAKEKTRKSDFVETMKSRSGGKQRLFLTNRTTKKDFGFARNMEKSDTSDWDMYFLNNRMGDEGYSTSDTTAEDANDMETNAALGNKKIDEAHLAKLVAKFDQRIEALWSTNENEQNENEQNENEYQDLPVDLQDLLASPTKQNVEILNVANKRVSEKSAKSFIQCGTNITSSIWTECLENDDDDRSISMYDSMSFSNFYNEQIESYPDKILGDQFNSLSVAAAAAESNDMYSLDKFRVAENETNLQFERIENSEGNSFFNKFGAIKNNHFTSLPWEIAFPSNFNNKKWSDAENININININFGENHLKRNINRAVNDSFITLNHNKEASCFKEVVPKQVLGLSSFESQNEQTKNLTPPVIVEEQAAKEEGEDAAAAANKEEEDLLTSTRTHFRPIKQENHDTSSNHGHHYADGTTFAIRSSLEHINYRRSESGTMYLESGFDTPKKYQEYRVNDQTNRCDTDTESCYSIEREFVLKFCVKQNEKCCQTEIDNESDVESASSQSHSPLEVPAKKRVLCDPDEFFFPGDEELLSDTVDGAECSCASRGRVKLATNLEPLFNASTEACSLHGRDSTVAEINWPGLGPGPGTGPGLGPGPGEGGLSRKMKDYGGYYLESLLTGGGTSWRKCDKCNNNWSTVWPKTNDKHHLNSATVWGSNQKLDTSSAQSWQQIWSSSEELCRTCLGVPAGSGPPPGRSLEYFKLREELSEDGEQLLSDLSCLQRVYMEQLPSTEVTCDLNELTNDVNMQPETQATTAATQTMAFVPVAPIAAIGITANSTKLFGLFGNIIPGAGATTGNGTGNGNGNGSGSKERKRRHSSSQRSCEPIAAAVARNSWTNSSCLRPELRCLFTPPLLRPVTL